MRCDGTEPFLRARRGEIVTHSARFRRRFRTRPGSEPGPWLVSPWARCTCAATMTSMAIELAPWSDLLEGDELAHVETEPAREPRLAPIPDDLHPRLRELLPFDALYTHQRAAWDAARRGEHVIVTTGTASGKTLAFSPPSWTHWRTTRSCAR